MLTGKVFRVSMLVSQLESIPILRIFPWTLSFRGDLKWTTGTKWIRVIKGEASTVVKTSRAIYGIKPGEGFPTWGRALIMLTERIIP